LLALLLSVFYDARLNAQAPGVEGFQFDVSPDYVRVKAGETVTFHVSLDFELGFSEDITFTAIVKGPFGTVTEELGTLSPPYPPHYETDYSYEVPNYVPNGLYNVTIKGESASYTRYDYVQIEVYGGISTTCCIVKAIYAEEPEKVDVIRLFRDHVLKANPLGAALVEMYYRVSPSLTIQLLQHPELKPFIKYGIVEPFYLVCLAYSQLTSYALFAAAALGAVVLLVAVKRKKLLELLLATLFATAYTASSLFSAYALGMMGYFVSLSSLMALIVLAWYPAGLLLCIAGSHLAYKKLRRC